jgi:chitinase
MTQPHRPSLATLREPRPTVTSFTSNLLKFLETYGYDGVDLDWEYPGAPDRGGKEDNAKNYVLLVETMRKALDNLGRKFRIMFAAPSSFWYLRAFDLPGIIKHIDWINIVGCFATYCQDSPLTLLV